MKIEELDTVVLETDIKQQDLKRGDIGAVVHVHSADAIEVEFVTASGHTQALATLAPAQIRSVGRKDVLAVRQSSAA